MQYHFTDEAGLKELQNAGKVIELRAYDTVHGVWKYFTADTEATDLENITMRVSAYWSPTGHFGIIMGQSE